MADYGVKMSKPNIDVFTATDKQLQFSSKFSTLKVFQTGHTTFYTDGSGNGSVTVPHNLGFAPAFYCFHNIDYLDTFFSPTTYSNCYFPIGGFFDGFTVKSDATNLYISGGSLTPGRYYFFKYFILVDRAQAFTGTPTISLPNDYGWKVAKEGKDVFTGKEYDMAYSTKYKSLQYYDESFKSTAFSLPGFTSSIIDQDPVAGCYADIMHGLGYPPLFFVYYHSTLFADANEYREIPFTTITGSDLTSGLYDAFAYEDRIRIVVKKYATYFGGPGTAEAETLTFKVYILTEDLDG